MTNEPKVPDPRLQELFIAELLFGLTADEQLEFEALDAVASEGDLQSLADLVGLLDQSRSVANATMLPQHLRERVRTSARNWLPRPNGASLLPQASFRFRSRVPWAVAATCLLVAAVACAVNWPFWRPETPENVAISRDRLVASAPDLVRADWAAGATPVPGASGDITWSTARQQGYMRFRGMRANDPSVEQYQLWIFDRNQNEKTPVDGGVFDILSDGELVVAMRPSLRIREPYLFAVTIEKPGGVVVSDRSRLPLLAAVTP